MRREIKSLLATKLVVRIGSRIRPGRVVALCFHDLRDDDDFSNWLRMPSSTFELVLRDLRHSVHFVGPSDLEELASTRRDRPNVLVTFDDGYANNLRLALPILTKYNVPALFFVSSGPMITQLPFRADRLVTPLQVLNLTALDLRRYGLKVYRFAPADGPERWEGIQVLLRDVKELGNDDHPKVVAILQHMESTYEQILSDHLARFRPMSPAEVRELSRSPLAYLGSHSHRHEILTRLEDDALDHNLITSRRILTDVAGETPTDFAYPNGDWDERVARRVQSAGYLRAWTVANGVVGPASLRMSLPRILVGGYDSPRTIRFQIARSLIIGA